MTRTPLGRLLIVACAVVIGLTAAPAIAQEEPQSTDEEQTAEEARQVVIEEIVVTAQRREEDVQEVPVSVSVLGGEELEVLTVGTPDVRVLSGRVPSLILESSFGRAFPRFYIRGLGNTDFDLNASQPVSMLVDEVVLENPVVKGMPLFDLDRVEVLRGPQGTLFGRNTPAGVVKFETRKPTQEYEGYFRGSWGTFDTVDVNGAISGPLSSTLSARFSGLYQYQSDWIDNKYEPGPESELGGYETVAGRLQFLWEPTERFSGLLNLHAWNLDGTARVFRANIIQPGSNHIVDWFRQDTVWQDGINEQSIDAMGGLLRFDYKWESATLTSITGYETLEMFSRGDIDGGFGDVSNPPYGPGFIPFSSESADGLPDLDQFTQELRIASTLDGPFNWLIGAFYFDESLKVDSFAYASTAGNIQIGYANQAQDATSWAVFGSVNFDLSDSFELSAGLRYTEDDKDFVADRPMPLFQPPLVAPITKDLSGDNVSWDVTGTYKANPNLNIYGRVATGYRAPSVQGRIMFCEDFEGGTNPATNCVTVADAEEILSIEAGFKSIIANRLRLNMTAYWYEVDGQQITAVGGEYNIATLLNADTTEGHGVEADVEWTPSGHLIATLGASWNPTEIKDPNLTVAPCGGGCTVTDPIIGGLAYVDGNPLPHAPDWIFNGIVTWRSDPVSKGAFATLDWTYYSDKNFFLYESKEFHDDALEFGLRVGYAWGQEHYEVAAFARNLFDAEILRGGIDFNNLTGYTNDPRIIGLEFVTRF